MAGLLPNFFSISLFRELCDLMRQPRNLSAGIVLVNDVALRRLHQFRLSTRHRLEGPITVAALDRFLDGSHRTTHLGPARLIDDSTAGDLSRGLPGGSGVGHILKILRQYPIANRARACGGTPRSTLICFRICSLENAAAGAFCSHAAKLKEQRRRDCTRRHWWSYRGRATHRQRLATLYPCDGAATERADKVLMRLNFRDSTVNGWLPHGVFEQNAARSM